MQISDVAFIGLGVMGFPMAGHLAGAGLNVRVYNRTAAKMDKWLAQYSGSSYLTPKEAVRGCQLVLICVGNDDDVRSVMYGEHGILSGCDEGTIVVDHTTASADLAKELELKLSPAQVQFLDAPVSGGQAGAENGQLTIMLGGEQSVYQQVQSTLAHYARFTQLIGPAGSGQQAKMMNQICIAGIVQGLAEALHFGQKVGLDCSAVVETISKGAAQSWQMENRATTMLKGEFDFGFAVDWMRKDLAIALDEARKQGAVLPLTALVDQFYADVQNLGGGRNDTSSLLRRFSN